VKSDESGAGKKDCDACPVIHDLYDYSRTHESILSTEFTSCGAKSHRASDHSREGEPVATFLLNQGQISRSVPHAMRGSETKLINLITLCYFHQRLVHERGWHVQVLEDGAFRFLRSKGESLDTSISKTPDSDASRITLHASRITDHGSRPPSQWRGDKMDYRLAAMIFFKGKNESFNSPERSKQSI